MTTRSIHRYVLGCLNKLGLKAFIYLLCMYEWWLWLRL
jgi:hypothetical protein